MPAGCEFICNNENCNCYKSGFTMTGPWPMAKIEIIIANMNPRNEVQEQVRKNLIKMKDEGRKYGLINFPNENKLTTNAYRVSLWSEDAKCIWNYDIPSEEYENWIQPQECPKTGGKLIPFKDVVENGIKCPSCGEELKQSRWATKEA